MDYNGVTNRNFDLSALSEGGKVKLPLESGAPQALVVRSSTDEFKEVLMPKSEGKTINLDYLVSSDGETITTRLQNNTAGTLYLVLGTPAGLTDEAGGVQSPYTPLFQGDAGAVDKIGASAPFVDVLARRLVRNWAIINKIEFLADDTALGTQQKTQAVTMIRYDFDANTCVKQGTDRPIWTPANFATLNKIIPVSDFYGMVYPVLAGVSMDINIYVGAKQIAQFS